MKQKLFGTITIALLFTISAFAGQKTFRLPANTSINGQQLAAGAYDVKYDIKGKTAEVRFLLGNKEVARASGQVVESDMAFKYDGALTKADADGTTQLVELQLGGGKSAIRFTSATPTGQ